MHPRGETNNHADEVVVFVGGDSVTPFVERLQRVVNPEAWAIAADSGLHTAHALGAAVQLVVGDFDSVDTELLATHVANGGAIDRHPVDKDRTDLEIALDHAFAATPRRITVIGGAGGRLDHLVANIAQLARPDLDDVEVVAYLPPATVYVVTRQVTITGTIGETVSLLAVHGDAHGVSTTGLAFPLDNEDLAAASSRGISNRLSEPHATVTVRAGRLLIIRPGAA